MADESLIKSRLSINPITGGLVLFFCSFGTISFVTADAPLAAAVGGFLTGFASFFVLIVAPAGRRPQ